MKPAQPAQASRETLLTPAQELMRLAGDLRRNAESLMRIRDQVSDDLANTDAQILAAGQRVAELEAAARLLDPTIKPGA